MVTNLEESDSNAGFYYDLKVVTGIVYVIFAVILIYLMVFSGYVLSTDFYSAILVFLSLFVFLDLQEFIEVKVPRYGWKCSKSNYRLASAFLLLGVLTAPIGNFLLNLTDSPIVWNVILFFLSIGLLIAIPIMGFLFAIICYLDFMQALKLSFWKRDQEVIKIISKHSIFYRKLSRHKENG
jgi:hypothetical protein